MKMKFLPLLFLTLGISFFGKAQVKESKKEKEESVTIRKKGDSKEKMTIVIDGENITVNGKPLDELKEIDVDVLRNKGMNDLLPRVRERMAPMGRLKMLSDNMSSGNRAFLGVTSEKADKGVKILSVEKESAAEKAGFKKDDIITKVGDTKIETSADLYDAIGKYKPEEKVTIAYVRDGKETTATATLGKSVSSGRILSFDNGNMSKEFNFEMPEMSELSELRSLPGLNGIDFDFPRKPKLGLGIQDVEEGKGVKVLDVDSDTPASKAGLQKDDVLSEIDGKTIASVDDLKEKLRDLKEGDSFKLTYKRAGQSKTTEIKFPKKLKTAEL